MFSPTNQMGSLKKGPKILLLLFLFIIILTIIDIFYDAFSPNIIKLRKENPKKTALMGYREKEAEKKGKKLKIQQIWVALSDISPYLIKAVTIAEDDKFWRHEGFDLEAIQKAIERDIKERKFKFGASTISQQLAKNLYLEPTKTPIRKIKEAIITWRIEKTLTKKRILEIYLNIAEWGDGIFGIEAASRHYYGKRSAELTAQEAARLASVLPNPRKYNPLSNSTYVENRSRIIYNIMVKRGIIMEEDD